MELTQEYVKALFDYKDGFLYWKNPIRKKDKPGDMAGYLFKNKRIGKKRTCVPRIYISLNGTFRAASRIIFLWHHGWLPPMVDHENRIGDDDRIENLRAANYAQNNRNKTSAEGSSSQYLGVSWCNSKNKWAVYITVNKKSIYGGRYICENAAALRYNELASFHHGEFANLNIIKPW